MARGRKPVARGPLHVGCDLWRMAWSIFSDPKATKTMRHEITTKKNNGWTEAHIRIARESEHNFRGELRRTCVVRRVTTMRKPTQRLPWRPRRYICGTTDPLADDCCVTRGSAVPIVRLGLDRRSGKGYALDLRRTREPVRGANTVQFAWDRRATGRRAGLWRLVDCRGNRWIANGPIQSPNWAELDSFCMPFPWLEPDAASSAAETGPGRAADALSVATSGS